MAQIKLGQILRTNTTGEPLGTTGGKLHVKASDIEDALALLATEATLDDVKTALTGLAGAAATETTLAAVLAKLSSDPATQTTLAALKTLFDNGTAKVALSGSTMDFVQPSSVLIDPGMTTMVHEANLDGFTEFVVSGGYSGLAISSVAVGIRQSTTKSIYGAGALSARHDSVTVDNNVASGAWWVTDVRRVYSAWVGIFITNNHPTAILSISRTLIKATK